MIFKNLKEKSLRKNTERNIYNRDTSQINGRVRTIGFLVDEQEFSDFEILYDVYKEVNLQPKDIKVFSFIESKKKLPSLRHNQVQSKDFDWKGNLHNQDAQEFLNKDLDVLVGLYKAQTSILNFMVSESKAKFKVGFQGADERLYDLLLAIDPSNISAFKKELKKYLQVLGKIEN